MISTYSEYIARYIRKEGLSESRIPGEHHFVSVYLVPKLFGINGIVPDYVNPDGSKRLIGDVIYYRDGAHHRGIEGKLGTARLTANEFNNWILKDDPRNWPHVFLGICPAGMILLTWKEFRQRYIDVVRQKRAAWKPVPIATGRYGPMKQVSLLMDGDERASRFPFCADPKKAKKLEARFLNALSHAIR